MGVDFKEMEKYLVVLIDGKLDSLNAKDIGEMVNKKLEVSDKDVVFDFEKLEYISSAGLQILISVAKNRKTLGKNVYIYKPTKMIDDIITVTGFYSFLKKINEL